VPTLFKFTRWPLVFGFVLFVAGCKKELPNANTPGVAPAAVHTGAPLTEADGQAFGAKLESAIAAGDTAAVKDLMRPAEILERSVSDLGLSSSDKKNLFTLGERVSSTFPEQFTKVAADGGSYDVIRVRMVAGRPRVIVRLMHPEGASNYHEYTLIRYPDNQIAAEDVYIYLSGEPLSHTFRRIMLNILNMQHKGFKNLNKEEQVLVDHQQDINTMTTMVRNGQHAEAFAIYQKLPAELHNNKLVQIVAIQAAGGSGDDEAYMAEMERFRKNFPKDAAGDLISIDYYLLQKKYDEALAAIDRLDNALGGDPYLNSMRANVFIEMGKLPEAREHADKALQETPKIAQVYWTKVTVTALAKDHDETRDTLKLIVEKIDPTLTPEDIKNDERFVEFVKTPQFEELKKWLAKRGE
jgi:tetratricopeptide (TPR) repeat protein